MTDETRVVTLPLEVFKAKRRHRLETRIDQILDREGIKDDSERSAIRDSLMNCCKDEIDMFAQSDRLHADPAAQGSEADEALHQIQNYFKRYLLP